MQWSAVYVSCVFEAGVGGRTPCETAPTANEADQHMPVSRTGDRPGCGSRWKTIWHALVAMA